MKKSFLFLALFACNALAQDSPEQTYSKALDSAALTEATELEDMRYNLSAVGFQCVSLATAAARQECFDNTVWDYQQRELVILAKSQQARIAAGAVYYGVPATLADVMAAAQAAKLARRMWPEVMLNFDW